MLLSKYDSKPIKELLPILTINGKKYIALTTLQAGIHKNSLGPIVADASSQRHDIIAAIEFLITGF
jgi:hypothetical protein